MNGAPVYRMPTISMSASRAVETARIEQDCLTKLGRDVQIVVKATPRSRKDGRLSIVFA